MRFYEKVKGLGLRRYATLAHDVVVAIATFFLAYVTVLGLEPALSLPGLEEKLLGFAAISAVVFMFFSLHRSSWRYVSIPDVITILKASVAAVFIYTVGAFLVSRGSNVPRSVPVLTMFFLVGGLAGPRLTYRLLMERTLRLPVSRQRDRRNTRYVLLYGLTDSAESFIRSIRRDPRGETTVVGLLEDNDPNRSKMVRGVKVLGSLDDLERVVAKLARRGIKVSELIVTQPAASRQQLGEIVEIATHLGIKASRIPNSTETAQITNNGLIQSKPIELADLLGRPEVNTDLNSIAALINGRKVLATGAGGSIGSELCRQIAMVGPSELVITDSSEFHLYLLDTELRERHPDLNIVTRIVDVRDNSRVSSLFGEFKPDVVFHAAALKHVPLVESNPLEAIKTNLIGTRNVSNAALANEAATFVMISTDKAVNPTNIMGATKRAAEAYCQALDVSSERTRFKTVRFGNVLGSNGSVVPRFQEQIAAGGPITVTHPNVVRFFMTIPEAVRLVLHASAYALRHQTERGKIMVLDMGKPVRIVDLAKRMIQLAGYRPDTDIEIVFTGLRPGEKLYEELFDSMEVQDERTREGFVIASPRIIDKMLIHRTLSDIEAAIAREDHAKAVKLLAHLVPEYQPIKRDSAPVAQIHHSAEEGY